MKKVSRAQCANCTCSPGLLSRSNRRTSWLAKQVNIKRGSVSGSPRPLSRNGSVFTIDAASLCLPEVKEVNTLNRLARLRQLMADYNVGVYIVPSEDEHQSEYVAPGDQKRSFISGFLGSAGFAIITRDVMCMNDTPEGLAALSTDSRYFSQATNELDFNWTLLRQGAKDQPSWEEWAVLQAINLSLDSGQKISIGVDPRLITYSLFQKLDGIVREYLAQSKYSRAEVELTPIPDNLIAKMWKEFEEEPPKPDTIIKLLDTKYTGQDVTAKIENTVSIMRKNGCTGLVVSALDEIAWLLNMRGSDIDYNPVFFSYLLLGADNTATLFADNTRFDTPVRDFLQKHKVNVKPYEQFWTELESFSRDLNMKNGKLLVPKNASWEIVRNIRCSFEQPPISPIEDLKSVKNEVELKGAREAHFKDGRALCRFFSWLEYELKFNCELIDEIQADEKLTEFRKMERNFIGLSFATISATGANGAMIHYKPMKGACSVINPNKLYLNDSGSQFLEGTTDVTRTVHFGVPTEDEILKYTLVLKGHVALAQLKFPENTTGSSVDAIARQYLWSHGLDYGHGTSHGVGAFLNVHEGPIGIGSRPSASNKLVPGHLISNEPGYYEDSEFGIRIENVMYVKDSGYIYNGKRFLEFDTLTRVPFCRDLINPELLSPSEKEWINKYHSTIWNELSPSFVKCSVEYAWLKRQTLPF